MFLKIRKLLGFNGELLCRAGDRCKGPISGSCVSKFDCHFETNSVVTLC